MSHFFSTISCSPVTVQKFLMRFVLLVKRNMSLEVQVVYAWRTNFSCNDWLIIIAVMITTAKSVRAEDDVDSIDRYIWWASSTSIQSARPRSCAMAMAALSAQLCRSIVHLHSRISHPTGTWEPIDFPWYQIRKLFIYIRRCKLQFT